jgi:cell wall-associated NlpC family hydrolase
MGSSSRLAALALCFAALLPLGASARPTESSQSWAAAQIALVTEHGIFRGTPETFRPDEPLTRQALAHAVARLTGTAETRLAGGETPVTLQELDAALVRAVGLRDAAYRVSRSARRAGLEPPARFGSEVVARLLGLRLNHPEGQDDLELQPQQAATRAEAAYSLAQILAFESSGDAAGERRSSSGATTRLDPAATRQVASAREAAKSFELPALSAWQRRLLTTASSYIGFPYVWGGTGEEAPGFDCSGFVWRVFRLTTYPDEGILGDTVRGRTTMAMSGEVASAGRIPLEALEPGDVLFFGQGPASKPEQVVHTGIYLGYGWFIHASRYGVAVAALDGWYRDSFAWARRPLAEAGLV